MTVVLPYWLLMESITEMMDWWRDFSWGEGSKKDRWRLEGVGKISEHDPDLLECIAGTVNFFQNRPGLGLDDWGIGCGAGIAL
jgi:hypothetical protein